MLIAIQFIKNNQKIVYVRIFHLTLDNSEESLISKKYLDFANIFSKYNSEKLSPLLDIDLAIELELRIRLLFSPIDNL